MAKNFKKYTKEEAQEARKQKLDGAMDMLKDGVREIFESGRLAEYLAFMGRFHTYSMRNQVLIMVQHPTATLVTGYKAWEKMNRHVRKGEKGINILAPLPCKHTVTYEDEVTGEEVEEEKVYMRYKTVSVFALDQTEGEDIPDLTHKLSGGNEEELKELLYKLGNIANCPVSFESIPGSANGYFSPDRNVIVVKESLPTLHKVKTLCHEMAHARLHGHGCPQESADNATMEVQAESVAFCVLNYLGLDSSEYSFGYVAGWAKDKGDKVLMTNLQIIRDTACGIIEALDLEEKNNVGKEEDVA